MCQLILILKWSVRTSDQSIYQLTKLSLKIVINHISSKAATSISDFSIMITTFYSNTGGQIAPKIKREAARHLLGQIGSTQATTRTFICLFFGTGIKAILGPLFVDFDTKVEPVCNYIRATDGFEYIPEPK